ncbi:MAG TPA: chemotaxis protein CheA, partial [Vicinamibacterales bacterium]
MSDEFFAGFLDDYFAECEEHLAATRSALLQLETAANQPAAQRRIVDDLFRYYHSLKGISAMVELRPAERLAHELENYLRAVRAGELPVTDDGLNLLIEGTQLLERIVHAHRDKEALPPIDDVVGRVAIALPTATPRVSASEHAGIRTGADGDSSAARMWQCTFAPTRELLAKGVGVDAIRKRLGQIGTIVDATPQVRPDGAIAFEFSLRVPAGVDVKAALEDVPVAVEALDVAPPTAASAAATGSFDEHDAGGGASSSPSQVVRVDLARLDELMRQVGDMVISRARLLDTLSRIEAHVPPVEWRAVQENAVAIDRQLRTLREGLMRVRLVPVGEIFRRMPFVVRDLAREAGKRITLLLQGQATEIDKYLIERMMDPVLHLVRNAVSHGIEPPEERIAHGKRPEGTITLSASAAGELVTIEIADDGRGVDAGDVIARARQAGLPVPAGQLDANAVLALLCAPGFSTKDEADRASGRGVGMAVVKETVERLSGTIALDSEAGVGTRFTIQLPLTLAIADALIGRVGPESFAVPQSVVREVIEVNASEVRQIEGNEIIPYRDASLSIVRLARVFGIEAPLSARFHVFVIGSGAGAVGFAVDRIVGQREIVVRAIADPLVRVDGISGATDLGDGRVVLILDPTALARLTR